MGEEIDVLKKEKKIIQIGHFSALNGLVWLAVSDNY